MGSKQFKILLAGGGTGGPVSPVLAVAEELKKQIPGVKFLFVGTKNGPEKILVAETGINFVGIRAARLRRYFSLMNVADVFVFLLSLVSSWKILRKFRPDLIFSAGGFVAVPLCWVGKMMGTKIVIHQQDARVGLANKLVIPMASAITTAFEQTAKNFHSGSGLFKKEKISVPEWVGNPVRSEVKKPDLSQKEFFGIHDQLPILLVLGGATGASQINQLVAQTFSSLVSSHQVIHQTGKGKNLISFTHPNYHPYELIPFGPYAAILNLAHIVVARAGLSTIAELSAAGKASIILPMPGSHQEENAKILKDAHAAIVLEKDEAIPQQFLKVITIIKFNPQRQKLLSKNIKNLMPQNAEDKIASVVAGQLK
ncbi:MAG: UDP-N-acetylglucosamine--N-acetylmuramyl-(pentapeptide) pyrophosphoryl-undecaprenol N-acetylglucosamine transferase [Candidatus Doudnabacteria bacterium]|nr:UDP-N-acetylglucosamine--N-acetylmuramyl-(pentapeptide) pyrophosphoryl-undecaprenol N-acetylglucosamine transferase [Candidatus Doudnabacteria bacterium]